MHAPIVPLNQKLSFREKARLNTCIAKDLSDSFGRNTAYYLRPLNLKLREEIQHRYQCSSGKAAAAA